MNQQDDGSVRHELGATTGRAIIEELYENAPVGCALVLEDATILHANGTLASMLACTGASLIGTSLLEHLAREDRIPAMQFLAAVTATNSDAPVDVHLAARNGTTRTCVLSASRNAQSGAIRLALTDESGRRAVDRMATLAQKMDAIGRMAGGIAHDLNNLLTVVRVHDDFLLNALPEEDPKREDLIAIKQAMLQAASLTAKLLSFARPQVLDRRRIAVHSLVEQVARTLRAHLRSEIALVAHVVPPSGDVEIDPAQLEQAITHLVDTAQDAMADGGRVTIETSSLELCADQLVGQAQVAPGWFTRIRVQDTGCGMDPPTLSHAFEPYFTTKPRGVAQGLGLSTVYAIARQHGGFVLAQSVEGEGTTVDLYLPEVDEAEPSSISAPTPEPVSAHETVLVAEDEPAIRTAIVRMLTKQGYRCHAAADGVEALATIEALNGKVDVLLSDVVMPNCTGPELVRRMREHYPQIPVVFMTGYASTEEVAGDDVPQSVGVLHKPFPLQSLQRLVREAIASSQPGVVPK